MVFNMHMFYIRIFFLHITHAFAVMRYSSLLKCIPLDCVLSVLECGGPLGVVGDMSLLVDVVAVVDGVGLPLDIGVNIIGLVVGPSSAHDQTITTNWKLQTSQALLDPSPQGEGATLLLNNCELDASLTGQC